jgi:Xrn1 helical domain
VIKCCWLLTGNADSGKPDGKDAFINPSLVSLRMILKRNKSECWLRVAEIPSYRDSLLIYYSRIVKAYCEGLCWVFKYYCEGCVSWSWYYPYYYAPMASDFVDLDQMKIEFELNAPLRPFEQLMGVLPAAR